MPQTERIAEIAKALAHPTRVLMLQLLAEGERCGCEFAPELELDPSVVSRFMNTLARAGLVESRREGVRVLWRLAHPQIPATLSQLASLTREKVV